MSGVQNKKKLINIKYTWVCLHCVVPENIHTPTMEMEGIGNSRGVGGQKPRKFQRGGGLTVKLTSRWFSLIQYRPTAVVVRKLLLADFGGTF